MNLDPEDFHVRRRTTLGVKRKTKNKAERNGIFGVGTATARCRMWYDCRNLTACGLWREYAPIRY